MGWMEYNATHYKRGNIDRLAECRAEFGREPDWGIILKDAMVGSTYYAAVKLTKSDKVFGLVVLTATRDGRYFAYKDMGENCGPYSYDCPESILKLLSPTDNQYALEWRAKCREKRKLVSQLNKATQIEVLYPDDRGGTEVLHKRKVGKRTYWLDHTNHYFTRVSQIIATGFKVIA